MLWAQQVCITRSLMIAWLFSTDLANPHVLILHASVAQVISLPLNK